MLLDSQTTTDAVDSLGRSITVDLLRGDWKQQSNFPTRDGITFEYCPPEQVVSEMDRLIEIYCQHREKGVESEVTAAWLHHRFTQIHPFQDGNGRVARAIASLVLIQDGLFPLVVHRDYRDKYIGVLESADKGDILPLIRLLIELQAVQFRKATYISEGLLAEDDLGKVIEGFSGKATLIQEERTEQYKKVFKLARAVEERLQQRLEAIKPSILTPLKRIDDGASVYVVRSHEGNDYFFRSQIIKNARDHLDYFADTSEYRAWISFNMKWSRRSARIVFTTHGLGKPFNGSLICSPFLEFRDQDDEGTQSTFIPIAEDGFVFFYTEDQDGLLDRFQIWGDDVLKVAIRELTRHL